jgi:hypothetical protein
VEDKVISTEISEKEKPAWTSPTVKILELREVESAADLEVAFTTQLTSGDL